MQLFLSWSCSLFFQAEDGIRCYKVTGVQTCALPILSRVGMGMSGGAWYMDPSVNFPGYFMPQGVSADLIATKYGFSRDDVDAYAVESQKRAGHSWDNGYFDKSVIPVKDQNGIIILAKDEHMRPTTTMQN